MSRLAREFQRLYAPDVPPLPDGPAPAHTGVRADVRAGMRALVLEVARPAQWQPLAAVWQGLQVDLGLPAPAIAANGTDGLQLWLSLAEPMDGAQGLALLDSLRQRYMAEVPLHRVTMSAAASPTPCAVQPGGPWSAFVAADLAPVFEDSPWLDLPPNDEGQADLLQRMASIQPAALAAARAQLRPQPEAPAAAPAPASSRARAPAPPPPAGAAHPQAAQFLLDLMQDSSAPLALRVEAAKALLPYGPRE